MPKISITLILFAVLCFLAISLWQRRKETVAVTPFMVLAALSALQALLVSLRWDFEITAFRVPQVLLAAVMPSLAWLAFRTATSGGRILVQANLVHALPLVLAIISLVALPDVIDIVLIAAFLIYGLLLLRLGLGGEAGFAVTAFDGVLDMRRAVWLLAFMMLGSATIDILVFLDFQRLGGQHAALMIGIGNLIWLLALGASVAIGSSTVPEAADHEHELEQESAPMPQAEDKQIAATIQALLDSTGLAKDPGLTLSRLARRAGLPARSVSNAINRVHGRNVSQYINDIRIAEACRLLRESDISVTQAIYASGFQTKSNFNREFLRVTGKTPSAWRKAERGPQP